MGIVKAIFAVLVISQLVSQIHCQNNNVTCPAGFECSFDCKVYSNETRGIVLPCGTGFLCKDNELPKRCPPGFYCPDSTQQLECPDGKWCPKGSYQPIDCPALASCAKQSDRYVFWGFFLYGFIIFGYLFFGNWLFQRRAVLLRRILEALGKAEMFYFFKEDEDIMPTAEFTKHSRQEPMEFVFENLEVRIRSGNIITNRLCPTEEKVILSGASGQFRSGRLSAIMGPSGAGKTTLMNVLLGKIPKSNGIIYVNGEEDRVEKYTKNIGFVPQDDVMITTLTVRAIVEHCARIRLPRTWTEGQKQELVQETIKVMGLAHIQDSVIGDVSNRVISGGERKRVNIAMELVSDPSALFLDEPTSGLDSSSSKAVMLYLKEIAKKLGITVVAILHQPRSDLFELVDDVILLGEGGRTVYSGPRKKTLQYFESIGYLCPEHANQADFYLDVISGEVRNTKNASFSQRDLFDSWDDYIAEHKEILEVDPEDEDDDEDEDDSDELSETEESEEEDGRSISPSSEEEEEDDSERDETSTDEEEGERRKKRKQKKEQEKKRREKKREQAKKSKVEERRQRKEKMKEEKQKKKKLPPPTIRETPGFLYQLLVFLQRAMIQQLSPFGTRMIDTFLHCVAGLVIGVAFFSQPTFIPPIPMEYLDYCPPSVKETFCEFAEVDNSYRVAVYLCMGVGIITVTIAVRTFYNDRLVYWREASAGTNTIAYFLAKNVADLEGMLVNSWMFVTAFYVVTAPRGSFGGYFIGIFLYKFCLAAIAYILSWLVPYPELFSVIIALILGLGTGSTKEVDGMGPLGYLTPSRWWGEAQYIIELNEDVMDESQKKITEHFIDWRFNYTMGNFNMCLGALVILAIGFRLLAYLAMRYTNRAKQR